MKQDAKIEITLPEAVKELLRKEAFRRKHPMGRLLLDGWVRTLQPSEQKSVRALLGVRREVKGADVPNHPPCDTCAVGHPRMPSKGPWHDKTCPEWRVRGYN